MCGINGIFNFNNSAINKKRIDNMNDSIKYRGPDEQGNYLDENIGLGHARLSIIDLASGHQPIFNEDKSCVIVFNGEIYNYKELRTKLVRNGHKFRTDSDTEVIVHLYEEYGVDCLKKLNGMFAFAIWDKRKERLFIARDRIGIKPLVYYYDDNNFIFSSEINGIISSDLISKKIDFTALNSYFTAGYIPAPLTIYEDVFKLEPGHYMIVNKKGITKNKYWDLSKVDTKDDITYTEAKNKLRYLLQDSVNKRLRSDVPLGTFLSGGVDSSIITGLASKKTDSAVNTFSIGYENKGAFDETDYAREVADLYQTNHNEFRLEYKEVLDIIPKVLGKLGEPFADYSILPTYLVSKYAKREVKVSLSGDGADELFAGYNKYLVEYYGQIYSLMPEFLREQIIKKIVNLLPDSKENNFLNTIRKGKKFVNNFSDIQNERHLGMMKYLDEDRYKEIFNNHKFTNDYVKERIIQLYSQADRFDKLNKVLFTDLSYILPYDMLTKVDLASMYNSLEVRVPFLDHRIIEFVMSLPSEFKMEGKKRKKILVETFKDILPKSIHNRPKKGFGVPVGEWFKDELRNLFFDVLYSKTELDLFNIEKIEDIYTKHKKRSYNQTKQLWSIFVFKYWLINQ